MDTTPAGWQVVAEGIRKDTELSPAGTGIVTVWHVPYEITTGPAKGKQHEVTVNERDFTAEGVRQAITAAVNSVHTVAQLKSDHA